MFSAVPAVLVPGIPLFTTSLFIHLIQSVKLIWYKCISEEWQKTNLADYDDNLMSNMVFYSKSTSFQETNISKRVKSDMLRNKSSPDFFKVPCPAGLEIFSNLE